jgi:hypothetical protein
MRDPHVVSLRYRLEPSKNVTFDNPQPVQSEPDECRLRLENGVLTLEMKEHFASADDAKEVVEEFLRAWEIDVALRFGSPEIHFIFEDAEVIDRDPPLPGSSKTLHASAISAAAVIGSLTVRVTRREYPEPPTLFRVSRDVETLWQRYQGYVDGREPLPSMAFFCLSVIEANARGRTQAARKYGIHEDILKRLGELTSARGDEKTARKFAGYSTHSPLTQVEIAWVESAVKAIIRRLGEYSSTTSLPEIHMCNLPNL